MDVKLLHKLIDAYGISGDEEEVREIIKKEIESFVDELYVDKMGNLIAHKKGAKPRVMLAAHMDEVGLMVKSIDETGKMRMSMIGFIEPASLVGQKVHIKTKPPSKSIDGVITTRELQEAREMEELPKNISELYIDTGLNMEQLKKAGVEIGDYVIPEEKAFFLGSEEFISGKAIDDRVGCYILIDLIKRLKNIKHDLYFVFTVQEEIGLYGAKTSAFFVEPDWAIAVDVTSAKDADKPRTNIVGEGPCLTIKDSEMIANKCINDWLKEIAKKKRIPLQLEVADVGTTDAMNISISRSGVPSTVIGVAVRNLHTTASFASQKDIKHCIELLFELLKKPPKICMV